MCSAGEQALRSRAPASSVRYTWKHIANAAASRPARFGLIGEPGGPARNTGRLRM